MNQLKLLENGLVKVYETDKGEKVVNGRELHEGVGNKRQFADWIKQRLEEVEAVENQDFISISQNCEKPNGGRPTIEYLIKLDTAKEMAMLERNEKGKEYRRYFIEVEKKFKQQSFDQSQLSPQLQMFNQMFQVMATLEIETSEQKKQINQLTETTQAIKDTIILQPDNWRETINKMINRIVDRVGSQRFREIRQDSYKLLERRAGVDLERRLGNYKARLFSQGSTRTACDRANKLDIIEQDVKLKEIYSAIIKEYTIKFVA
jgi:anti-repressor protein